MSSNDVRWKLASYVKRFFSRTVLNRRRFKVSCEKTLRSDSWNMPKRFWDRILQNTQKDLVIEFFKHAQGVCIQFFKTRKRILRSNFSNMQKKSAIEFFKTRRNILRSNSSNMHKDFAMRFWKHARHRYTTWCLCKLHHNRFADFDSATNRSTM